MCSWAMRSSSSVVTPGLISGVSRSSTSEARRPATRMPSMSAADLVVIVMGRNYPTRPVKSPPLPVFNPPQAPMSVSPKHLLHFEGGNAVSAFRAQALLARLASTCPRIVGLSARYVHWVWSDAALDGAARDKLASLLTYGDAATSAGDGALVMVMP